MRGDVAEFFKGLRRELSELPYRFSTHDRNSGFTAAFDEVIRSESARSIRSPVRAPSANALIERWIGTARLECVDRILIVNRRHLELNECSPSTSVIATTIAPHRSLQRQPSIEEPPPASETVALDRVRHRDVLGGPTRDYDAAA